MSQPQGKNGLRVGLVAGEASGDLLGAGMIEAIRERHPDAVFEGVAGPRMRAAGCDTWEKSEAVSVMGLAEVLGHLPRLLKLRRHLVERFRGDPPDVFVGIDAPDFNLGLERQLRRSGIPTTHYVSPTVWAWRASRLKTISRSTDLVLCVFPFEKDYYDENGIRAEFVGHPLADEIPLHPDNEAARRQLGLNGSNRLIAVLPGSRQGEVRHLGADFAGAIAWLHAQRNDTRFVVPLANEEVRRSFEAALAANAPGVPVMLLDGQSREAMAAADAVLLASGTASLEAALLKRPMVVAYRVSALTMWLLNTFRMIKVRRFALPNLLADKYLVPEFLQGQVTPESLGSALLEELNDDLERAAMVQAFETIHVNLRRDASQRAAEAVLKLIGRGV